MIRFSDWCRLPLLLSMGTTEKNLFFIPPHQLFTHTAKIPPEPSLPQALSSLLPALSADPHRKDAPVPAPFCWARSDIFLVLGSPELDPALQMWPHQHWTQHSRCGLTSTEKRGRIRSLVLLAMLFLLQPRMLLALLATRLHCHSRHRNTPELLKLSGTQQ